MITKERAKELIKRADAGLQNCSFAMSRQFYTDLLALLSDYEKARPLLEAVSGALVYGADDPGPEPVFDHDCLTVILEKALAYKESSHD